MVMRKLSHILFTGLILMSFTVSTRAQDDKGIKPITKSGSAAFIFSMSGFDNFGLGGPAFAVPGDSGTGYIFHAGAKSFIADDLAIRAMLSFSSYNNGDDNEVEKSSEIGIAVGIEKHLPAISSISPYIGGEIGFVSTSIESAHDINVEGANPSQQPQGNYKLSGTGIVINAIAGFDWFLFKGIAIGGEFALGFQTSSSTNTSTNGTETDGPSPNAFGITDGTNIHLVVYF
jgi:hypothetical protein